MLFVFLFCKLACYVLKANASNRQLRMGHLTVMTFPFLLFFFFSPGSCYHLLTFSPLREVADKRRWHVETLLFFCCCCLSFLTCNSLVCFSLSFSLSCYKLLFLFCFCLFLPCRAYVREEKNKTTAKKNFQLQRARTSWQMRRISTWRRRRRRTRRPTARSGA